MPRGDQLEAAVVREGRKGSEALESLVLPSVAESSETPPWVPQVREAQALVQGPAHIVVPASRALLRVAVLPADDPEEIQGMVELQIDKLAPYPIEHCLVSWEVLERPEPGHVRVIMAAIPRGEAEAWEDRLDDASVRIERIDIDLLVWLYHLKQARRLEPQGRKLLIILDAGAASIVLMEQGQPVHVGTYTQDADESLEQFVRDLGEEIRYTLTAIESELGRMEPDGAVLWHVGPTPPGCDELQSDLGMPLKTSSLGDLPAPVLAFGERGLAHQAAGGAPDLLNLVPSDWVAEREGKAFQAKLMRTLLAAVAVWVVLVGAAVAFFSYAEREVQALARKKAALELDVEVVKEIERDVESLRQFSDRSYSSLESLREVSVLMPPGIVLTGMTYKKSKEVKITGRGGSNSSAYDFVGMLEKSALFVDTQVDYVKPDRGSGSAVTFRITATLPGVEVADEGEDDS